MLHMISFIVSTRTYIDYINSDLFLHSLTAAAAAILKGCVCMFSITAKPGRVYGPVASIHLVAEEREVHTVTRPVYRVRFRVRNGNR